MPKSPAARADSTRSSFAVSSASSASNSGPGGSCYDACPRKYSARTQEPLAYMITETTQSATAVQNGSGSNRRVKAGVMPLFSTFIYRCENGPAHLNEELERLAGQLMETDGNAARRTNFGGWHYAYDLFELKEPVVALFQHQMKQHVRAFLNFFRTE